MTFRNSHKSLFLEHFIHVMPSGTHISLPNIPSFKTYIPSFILMFCRAQCLLPSQPIWQYSKDADSSVCYAAGRLQLTGVLGECHTL